MYTAERTHPPLNAPTGRRPAAGAAAAAMFDEDVVAASLRRDLAGWKARRAERVMRPADVLEAREASARLREGASVGRRDAIFLRGGCLLLLLVGEG